MQLLTHPPELLRKLPGSSGDTLCYLLCVAFLWGCVRSPAPSGSPAAAPLSGSPGPSQTEVVAQTPGAGQSGAARSPLEAKALAEEVERTLQEVKALRKAQKHDEALRLIDTARAMELPPDLGARVLFARGETCFAKGSEATKDRLPGVDPGPLFKDAVKCLEDAAILAPKGEKAGASVYLLGSSFLMLEDYARALDAYQRAYSDYPGFEDRARALLRIGVCQAALGEFAKARELFSRLVREFPGQDSDVKKAQKYLLEMQIVGRQAPPLRSDEWLVGTAAAAGLASFEGEAVFLVFFATWCENCSEELPHLRRLIQRWDAKGLVFVGIANPDDPKNTSPVAVYVQKNQLSFVDVALDRTEGNWIPYRVSAMPAGVLIDRKGIIRWRGHPAFFPGPLVERALSER